MKELRVGWVFPGQGAKELPEAVERALARGGEPARFVDLAARQAGLAGAREVLVRGARALEQTSVAQPVLAAVCYGQLPSEPGAAAGARPVVALGQSLGELLAWLVASEVPPEVAIALAARRGLAMEDACRLRPGSMLAIGAIEDEALERALVSARQEGLVAIASMNGPRERVLGGDRAAVRVALRLLGGTVLRTAGAFHTPLMASAVQSLRQALAESGLGSCSRRAIRLAWSKPDAEPASHAEELEWLAESVARPIDFGLAVRRARARADELRVIGPPSAVLGALRSPALAPVEPASRPEAP